MWSEAGNSFKVLHIVSNKIVDHEALSTFKADFESILNSTDRLAANYTGENFNIQSHDMFDALYTQDGKFVACTGIFKRPQWPEGMYRLLNRTYFSPAFRKSYKFGFFASDYLLPSQIQRCNRPLDFTFVSRQGENGGNFLKKLQERPFFKTHYKVSENYIQVAPGLDDKSFQKILYYKKNPSLSLKLKSISDLHLLPHNITETEF